MRYVIKQQNIEIKTIFDKLNRLILNFLIFEIWFDIESGIKETLICIHSYILNLIQIRSKFIFEISFFLLY